MKIFKFRTIEEGAGRPFLIAFPVDKIDKIESQSGSQGCYLKINGIEVKGSYDSFIKELEDYDPSVNK